LHHRVLSLAYPVRAFACAAGCGWQGVLTWASALARRKRQARWVLLAAGLAAGSGWAVWRYRAELAWTPPSPVDGDEVGAAE
jgi:hypothetical protein